MKKKILASLAIGLLLFGIVGVANAVQFDFTFFDNLGDTVGDGFYIFDDISPGTSASFSSLTNFSWKFDISSYGLLISSANDDIPSSDSLTQEGIVLSGTIGSRTLSFFDNIATYVLHHDPSATWPTGVEFKDTDSSWARYLDGVLLGEGTFVATESAPIPEPTTMLLFGSGLVGLAGFRRKKK